METIKKKILFSTESARKMFELSFSLFVEEFLIIIGQAVKADRLAYFNIRSQEPDPKFYLASGIGPFLPIVGTEMRIHKKFWQNIGRGGWNFVPTPGTGWDAIYPFFDHRNELAGAIAIDDTDMERSFNKEEVDFLQLAADWFGVHRLIKYELIDLKRRLAKNRREPDTDELSGLLSQRATISAMRKIISKWKREKISRVSLALADLDDLKFCNGDRGRSFSNYIIQALGRMLKQEFDDMENCAIGRYGGDEFVIIAELRADEMQRRLNKILERFKDSNLGTASATYYGSFSAGIAELSVKKRDMPIEQNMNNLFQAASALMFGLKKANKGTIDYRTI